MYHVDFKIVAGANAAKELMELVSRYGFCLSVHVQKNGETWFDGFDIAYVAAQEVEAVARKYATMPNPGKDDGISYIRKGENPGDEIVEYTNQLTSKHVVVALDIVD